MLFEIAVLVRDGGPRGGDRTPPPPLHIGLAYRVHILNFNYEKKWIDVLGKAASLLIYVNG